MSLVSDPFLELFPGAWPYWQTCECRLATLRFCFLIFFTVRLRMETMRKNSCHSNTVPIILESDKDTQGTRHVNRGIKLTQ